MDVKKKLILVFAILGCVAGAVAVWRFMSPRPSTRTLATGPRIEQLYEQQNKETVDRSTANEINAENLKNAVIVSALDEGIEDADRLGEAVNQTLSVYAEPHVDEFIDWQVSAGIKPFPKWQKDPGHFQSVWDMLRATFVFADIDETRVRVVKRSWNSDRSSEAVSQIKAKRRPEGRPFLDGHTDDLEICEVLLPGLYPTMDGDFVETELGIEMTKRPDNGDWVITGIYHYADKFPPPRIAIPPL